MGGHEVDVGDLAGHVPQWVLLVAVGAPGVWAVATRWMDNHKARGKERVDLVRLAEEVSAKAIARLQAQIDALEAELNELRKEHADTIASKDAELALLRGQLRQALALADVYERKLTENGIPHEKPAQPFFLVPAGDYPAEISAV